MQNSRDNFLVFGTAEIHIYHRKLWNVSLLIEQLDLNSCTITITFLKGDLCTKKLLERRIYWERGGVKPIRQVLRRYNTIPIIVSGKSILEW